MRRASREINTLSLSALDLFATAMGAFAIIMLILFPHYNPKPIEVPPLTKDPRPDKPFVNSLGMKFVPVPTGPPVASASGPASAATPSTR
jgi:hypothetical protein